MCLVKLSLELYWQTTEYWGTDMQMKCAQNETLTLSRNNKLHPRHWLAHTFPFTPRDPTDCGDAATSKKECATYSHHLRS